MLKNEQFRHLGLHENGLEGLLGRVRGSVCVFGGVSAVFLQRKGAGGGMGCLEEQFCLQLPAPQIIPRAGVGSATAPDSLVTEDT